MNLLSPPREVIGSAAKSVLGRVICFLFACSLGGGIGFVITDSWNRLIMYAQGVLQFDRAFISGLVDVMLIVPTSGRFPGTWEIASYSFCMVLAFVFIRFDLGLGWLLLPLTVVACGVMANHIRFEW
jgi:hypothetical protein